MIEEYFPNVVLTGKSPHSSLIWVDEKSIVTPTKYGTARWSQRAKGWVLELDRKQDSMFVFHVPEGGTFSALIRHAHKNQDKLVWERWKSRPLGSHGALGHMDGNTPVMDPEEELSLSDAIIFQNMMARMLELRNRIVRRLAAKRKPRG